MFCNILRSQTILLIASYCKCQAGLPDVFPDFPGNNVSLPFGFPGLMLILPVGKNSNRISEEAALACYLYSGSSLPATLSKML